MNSYWRTTGDLTTKHLQTGGHIVWEETGGITLFVNDVIQSKTCAK